MGIYIELDTIEATDRLEAAFKLKCKCGHELGHHASTLSRYPTPYDAGSIFVSQCCLCGVTNDGFECECFELA